jgi:hypothetical protein
MIKNDFAKVGAHVAALRRIADAIPTTIDAEVGATGYLDRQVQPTTRAAKGVDKHGRLFITLCVAYEGRDDRASYDSRGALTIFQRYSDGDAVTQANNSECPPQLLMGGRATDDEMKMLEELVTTGTASCVVSGVIGGTLHAHYKLVEPSDAHQTNHRARFVNGAL